MSRKSYSSAKGRRVGGSFIALPHELIDHENFHCLSHRAVRMLITLYGQFKGSNNGDFTAAYSVLRNKGWNSNDQIYKALKELQETGWLIKTRQGYRPSTASLYAVSFLPINSCDGKLDVNATSTAPGYWKLGHNPTI